MFREIFPSNKTVLVGRVRDLNPIEQLFAKLKRGLRKAAKRTTDAVCDAIGHILATVTSAECANYFANSGYD